MTDLVKQLVGALEGMLALDEENHQRYPGDEDVCKEVQDARAALTAAKAGGWVPIEQASDEDKRRCWVLVGESVHLAAYIEIGFEEKRDLDGRYIYQVDPDAYWMDIDSGDPLEPSHFQPLTQPLPNPPKEQA